MMNATAARMSKPPQPSVFYTMLNDEGLRNNYPSKAKGVSIFASVISILVYTSIFYMFNLSPSSVFRSTKFWFFFCNTLIIIIAADYGSFSSSSDKSEDAYNEYLAKTRPPPLSAMLHPYYTSPQVTVSPPPLKIPDHEDKNIDVEKKTTVIFTPSIEEEKYEIKEIDSSFPTQDSVWMAISKEENMPTRTEEGDQMVDKVELIESDHNQQADIRKVSKFRRTKSETTTVHNKEVTESKMNSMHRWHSAKHEAEAISEFTGSDTDNEYAAMSNEELNQRVEEFIQKFNRQIRLQRHIY